MILQSLRELIAKVSGIRPPEHPLTCIDGPDFICVGMPKAGTGWLYDQLDAHPDFWMPPVKELVYLNKAYPPLGFVTVTGKRVRPERLARLKDVFSPHRTASPGGERLVHRYRLRKGDAGFLKRAGQGKGRPRDLDFYASLFGFKGGRLSGDITPPYCNLERETVREFSERFPQTKVLMMVRDPVERVWSRINMARESGAFDLALLDSAHKFRGYVEHQRKLGGLFATKVYKRWQRAAPQMTFGVFFFDDVAAAPEKARGDILRFLGADPEKKSGKIPPDYNRKAKAKLEMPPLAREVLVEHFRDELKASAEMFGGPARNWPALYGL